MEATGKHTVLALEGEIVIQRIEDVRQQILLSLHQSNVLELDCSKMTAIDTTGFQLLCSAHRTAMKMGGDLFVTSPAPQVLETLRHSAGLEREHGCALDLHTTCLWKFGEIK
jgi:anti-anti-sigma factor